MKISRKQKNWTKLQDIRNHLLSDDYAFARATLLYKRTNDLQVGKQVLAVIPPEHELVGNGFIRKLSI